MVLRVCSAEFTAWLATRLSAPLSPLLHNQLRRLISKFRFAFGFAVPAQRAQILKSYILHPTFTCTSYMSWVVNVFH